MVSLLSRGSINTCFQAICITLILMTDYSFINGELSGVEQSEDGSSGTISFKPPELDDEDSHSLHMPENLKCDACRIIAHLMSSKFKEVHEKRPSLKMMPESEVIDILEGICSGSFDMYGIKDVKGVKRLSGPGLETHEVAGVMQAGGRWPPRIREMCLNYVGELEEMEIYKGYLSDSGLENFLCRGSGFRGICKKGKEEL